MIHIFSDSISGMTSKASATSISSVDMMYHQPATPSAVITVTHLGNTLHTTNWYILQQHNYTPEFGDIKKLFKLRLWERYEVIFVWTLLKPDWARVWLQIPKVKYNCTAIATHIIILIVKLEHTLHKFVDGCCCSYVECVCSCNFNNFCVFASWQ